MANDRLPNPNRYIIENDADGNSFFSTALPAPVEVRSEIGGALQRLSYQTEQSPVSLSGNNDLERYKTALQTQSSLVTPGGGANVWYNDIPPNAESSPMHRTVTFDIVIVVTGEVELTLSNDETRVIKPGDMVIQRSTLHKWRNPSKTQWARMVAIVSECQPYVTEKGEALGAYFSSN
ncbi:hypothetical protein EV356DRAFT_501045 [Viridothelium virens]|uniref:Cupin type-2 domain-containing protein n=1 Tax=Viridothelium virens TaxID=1048519 RepID=A0A6A6H9X3_VIRVR|nr:hypothetical protein EV356DRAFT_501045 [Viridothelium virens]